MTNGTPRPDGGRTTSPERLAFHIAQTREQLGDTIEELAEKADVKARAQEKAARVKSRVRESAAGTAGTVRERTTSPPVLAAAGAAALAVTALLVLRRRGRTRVRRIGPWKLEVRR